MQLQLHFVMEQLLLDHEARCIGPAHGETEAGIEKAPGGLVQGLLLTHVTSNSEMMAVGDEDLNKIGAALVTADLSK